MQDIILFGMQGSGKGTQARILAEKLGYKIFETGGQLRRLASEDSDLGREVKEITTAGKLVSNEIVMKIVANFLENFGKNEHAIFDGIPRSESQRVSLEEEFAKVERKPLAVYISLTREEALNRLLGRKTCAKCGKIFGAKDDSQNLQSCPACGGELKIRADDTREAIETRLNVYENETVPAIEKYREEGRLIEIEGIKGVEEVNAEIVAKLGE
ncbi:nucleoside monophosphate kinase [Patescibacteria group bacterium]|nr:nucleoside monophosphate kinase [Patescibacteria group bacterium]